MERVCPFLRARHTPLLPDASLLAAPLTHIGRGPISEKSVRWFQRDDDEDGVAMTIITLAMTALPVSRNIPRQKLPTSKPTETRPLAPSKAVLRGIGGRMC